MYMNLAHGVYGVQEIKLFPVTMKLKHLPESMKTLVLPPVLSTTAYCFMHPVIKYTVWILFRQGVRQP